MDELSKALLYIIGGGIVAQLLTYLRARRERADDKLESIAEKYATKQELRDTESRIEKSCSGCGVRDIVRVFEQFMREYAEYKEEHRAFSIDIKKGLEHISKEVDEMSKGIKEVHSRVDNHLEAHAGIGGKR